ncbi:response regulator transcription factor [Alicyclobacillus cycloheptanicus]|uniref:NarL family two-component system response regulator LiaR n=1 Tax=Alicyclobacillus cycloheptanicus TaxID=1457 RepID=A0ABT9XFY0_9BACL|nr:response regulator transcription factor [Alicyclobacillus cycloheptanicus]MDQ0189201.1 NarL family two-component system response regulator LiaR [Alicyclobacillus cycloheptanicus]WDM00387.1 response regulator transcription factor [Alicyclobacillus cycloheptanicus]
MISVLIVDDHEIVRMGLRNYLETEADIVVVGEAGDGPAAVAEAMALMPDVILMDLIMPGMSGVEVTRTLQEQGCSSRVIVLTSAVDDAQVVEALRAGALSYLLKTSTAGQVASAIRKAAQGESVLDEKVQQSLVGQLQTKVTRELWQDLTDRELDVLRAIASGKNNQEIADALQIGVKTVKTHVSNIFIKLGVQDRTQAAIYAIRNGLA